MRIVAMTVTLQRITWKERSSWPRVHMTRCTNGWGFLQKRKCYRILEIPRQKTPMMQLRPEKNLEFQWQLAWNLERHHWCPLVETPKRGGVSRVQEHHLANCRMLNFLYHLCDKSPTDKPWTMDSEEDPILLQTTSIKQIFVKPSTFYGPNNFWYDFF